MTSLSHGGREALNIAEKISELFPSASMQRKSSSTLPPLQKYYLCKKKRKYPKSYFGAVATILRNQLRRRIL